MFGVDFHGPNTVLPNLPAIKTVGQNVANGIHINAEFFSNNFIGIYF